MVFFHFKAQQVIVLSEDIALTLIVNDARMVAARTVGRSHNVAFHLPRPGGVFSHGVADTFRAASGSVSQIILAITFVEPRTFLIVLQLAHAHDGAAIGNHVFVQRHIIQVRVTPVHIGLSVIVNPDSRVNVFPMFLLPYKRFSDRVFKWSIGRIGNQYADAVPVEGAIHIKLTIALHYLLCPCTVITLTPSKLFQGSDGTVVCPVYHIGRGIKLPVEHFELVALCIVFIVAGIEEDGVVIHHRGRVCRILGLDNRLLCCGRKGEYAQCHQG